MKKIIVLFIALMITFSFAESHTFADEEYPRASENGYGNDHGEDRNYSWLGIFGFLGLLGRKRRETKAIKNKN